MRSFGLQQFQEVINGQVSLTQDCPERAAVQFGVIGDHQLGERRITAQYDVAAVLPPEPESGPPERLDRVLSRDARQSTHTATSMASKDSSGMGSLSSSKARI